MWWSEHVTHTSLIVTLVVSVLCIQFCYLSVWSLNNYIRSTVRLCHLYDQILVSLLSYPTVTTFNLLSLKSHWFNMLSFCRCPQLSSFVYSIHYRCEYDQYCMSNKNCLRISRPDVCRYVRVGYQNEKIQLFPFTRHHIRLL